jgi:hypothetical protein
MLLLILLLRVLPMPAMAQWQLGFEKSVQSPSRQYTVFSAHHEQMTIDFVPHIFWTAHELTYKGRKLNQATGFTGTVFHWDGEAIGTGHKGKKLSEVLGEVILTVDQKQVQLVSDGKLMVDPNFTTSGKHVRLLKRSVIGPMAHEAQFDLHPDGNGYTVTHSYTVLEEITPKRFAGFRYVFMQMMPKEIYLWTWFDQNGDRQSGEMSRHETLDPKAKNQFVFKNVSFKGLACYAPQWQMGVAYCYPVQYAGTNHYLDRIAKDNKFRGILFEKEHYDVGEKMTWHMRVEPFSAPVDTWQSIAWRLITLKQRRHPLELLAGHATFFEQ